jgi:3-methyladenine DNA glycosylase AlkC
LKDWFDRKLLDELAGRFRQNVLGFDRKLFLALAGDGLEHLEMMDRVRQIAAAMGSCFPGPTSRDMPALVACMGASTAAPEEGNDLSWSGYVLWPFGEFIGQRGLDDWPASWLAMEELTQRLTSEFAVRPFLAADLAQSLTRLEALITHPSHHVRRWVSEGTRTRLPWAKAVPALRSALPARLAFLETLKADPSPYVRRSVANHLQDILKDDLEPGLEVLERWAALADERVDWVVKHAARGLLKSGHPRVLALYGWDKPVLVEHFNVFPGLVMPRETVRLNARVRNPGSHTLGVRLDYAWEGPTPSGRRFKKVFRWAEFELAAGQRMDVAKSHPFLERSTRRLPPGTYDFTILANGVGTGSMPVRLWPEGALEVTAEPAGSSLPGVNL